MSLNPGLIRPASPSARPLLELAHALGLRTDGGLRGVVARGLSVRAGDVDAGYLFVALPGASTHGARFADEARRRGAVAVLTDEAGAVLAEPAGLPLLVSSAPREQLGDVAGWIHRTAERMPLLLGVTGTNGKTTTVHLLQHLLERLGTPTGVSSTAERGFADEHVPSRLTTPEADELHALLARMAERGARAAAVEVSAQALVRSRVGGLVFDVAGFTNLSHDHLDDFGTMDDYLEAKAMLFRPGTSRRAVVCVDSPAGRRLAASAGVPVATLSSTPGVQADWTVADVDVRSDGTRFALTGPDGERLVSRIDALGAHQAVDAALALVMAREAGFPFARIARAVAPGLPFPVGGRLERVPGSVGPAVFLDVGHTPDAIEKSLLALRAVTSGRLVVLFGADGDRDATKRGPMGRVAGTAADVVIVHDHHSRHEDPEPIRRAILAGARGRTAEVRDVPDPTAAIGAAIEAAGADGTVLWAGTGRTEYRDVGGTKHPYSFWKQAERASRAHASLGQALAV